MPVTYNGQVCGCDLALERRAHRLRGLGEWLGNRLAEGFTIPNNYVLAGENFAIIKITATANNSTDNYSAINAALTPSRGGQPTIVVLPPAALPYVVGDGGDTLANMSANTYFMGYGATIRHSALLDYSISFASNSGVFGMRKFGHPDTMSRWRERADDDPNNHDPLKDGTVSQTNGGGNDTDAHFTTGGADNVIIADVQCRGSLSGTIRASGPSGAGPFIGNHFYYNIHQLRTHSDGIHINHGMSNITVARCSSNNTGDDSISFVSYDRNTYPNQIRRMWAHHNLTVGGRGRGIANIGGAHIVVEDNIITDHWLAGMILSSPGPSPNYHDVVNSIYRRNLLIRNGRLGDGFTQSNFAGVALDGGSPHIVNSSMIDNEAFSYGEFYAPTNIFCRESSSGGSITVTQSGNSHTQMVSSA